MTSRLPEIIRSRRLTVVLLVAAAALAVSGTLLTPERAGPLFQGPPGLPAAARFFGLVETHRSPVFLLLALAACVNLVGCTWHRAAALGPSGAVWAGGGSHSPRLLLDVAMHLSLLAIVGGGVGKGLWGSVRTRNIHVGQSADAFYDFALDRDVPLGFTVEVLERQDSWYPLRAQIGISDPATGKKRALVEAVEGRTVVVPGIDLALRVEGASGGTRYVRLVGSGGGRTNSMELETVGGGRSGADFGPLRLTLVAWQREIKRVRGRIACRGAGMPPVAGWVSPQERLTCGGVGFAMTAWGTDPDGYDYIGLQAVRDPAAPLFWGGCIVFALSLTLFIALRMREPEGRAARARKP